MIITAHYWLNAGPHCILIVVGKDDRTREAKAYIGVASGLSQDADVQHVVSHGAKFHACYASEISDALNPKP